MDTPVLIPNTEVKHISGDNSWTGSSKDSTLPGNLTHHLMGLFLLISKAIKVVQSLYDSDDSFSLLQFYRKSNRGA